MLHHLEGQSYSSSPSSIPSSIFLLVMLDSSRQACQEDLEPLLKLWVPLYKVRIIIYTRVIVRIINNLYNVPRLQGWDTTDAQMVLLSLLLLLMRSTWLLMIAIIKIIMTTRLVVWSLEIIRLVYSTTSIRTLSI